MIVWVQTAADRHEAEGPENWRAYVTKDPSGRYIAWVERESSGPLDALSTETASDWYYTLAGAQAWCADRFAGLGG